MSPAIFEKEGSDAWFIRPVDELVPATLSCPDCGGHDFTREEDILDVWFDSGVSWASVVEQDPRFGGRADLYLEGSDQHRGWFHTALLTSLATRGRAPYDSVLTHGFTLDGKGRKMSKSLGNVIAPQEIMKKSGAEILAPVGRRPRTFAKTCASRMKSSIAWSKPIGACATRRVF